MGVDREDHRERDDHDQEGRMDLRDWVFLRELVDSTSGRDTGVMEIMLLIQVIRIVGLVLNKLSARLGPKDRYYVHEMNLL